VTATRTPLADAHREFDTRLFAALRRRPWVTLAVGAALEVLAMAAFAPADEVPPGAPGAVGVAIAVLTALAAGAVAGVTVSAVGWVALFFLVGDRDALTFVALPIWVFTAYLAGRLAKALARHEGEQDELRRLDDVKTQFVELASHELRAPATVIAGIAATLHLRGDHLSPDQRVHLRSTLYENAQRLTVLTGQLLDLSRLDAEAIEIHPEPFYVRTRVEEILLGAAGDRAGDVRLEIAPDLRIAADPRAFDRIASNLLTNALRYGEAPIVVTAVARDRHYRLSVEDRGRGVAAEFRPRLFERFARDSASADRAAGTGLGLAIARSYARAHGGDLVYTEAEPRGARFELLLPRER
jgi:signal transduction histidine kinase